jgi:hypothetical protein
MQPWCTDLEKLTDYIEELWLEHLQADTDRCVQVRVPQSVTPTGVSNFCVLPLFFWARWLYEVVLSFFVVCAIGFDAARKSYAVSSLSTYQAPSILPFS